MIVEMAQMSKAAKQVSLIQKLPAFYFYGRKLLPFTPPAVQDLLNLMGLKLA